MYLLLCCWGRQRGGADEILRRVAAVEGAGAHFTINYFWLQMITYHITMEMMQQKKQQAKETEGMVFTAYSMQGYQFPPLSVPLAVVGPAATAAAAAAAAVTEADAAPSVADSLLGTTNMPFATFLLRPHCQALRNSLLYEKYYSRSAIDSADAAVSFVLPDLKQLPSAVTA